MAELYTGIDLCVGLMDGISDGLMVDIKEFLAGQGYSIKYAIKEIDVWELPIEGNYCLDIELNVSDLNTAIYISRIVRTLIDRDVFTLQYKDGCKVFASRVYQNGYLQVWNY